MLDPVSMNIEKRLIVERKSAINARRTTSYNTKLSEPKSFSLHLMRNVWADGVQIPPNKNRTTSEIMTKADNAAKRKLFRRPL